MNRWVQFILTGAISLVSVKAIAEDWSQYRGPAGAISPTKNIPTEWSDKKNVVWKADLPGPGSSSPIIVGDRVFITCYTGYGIPSGGDPSKLKRHLICINRLTGKTEWATGIDAVLPEDPYRGYIMEHGYASSTPVSDGENVYVFFGKSGVVAYDLAGNKLWQTSVGIESDNRRWGSASSPLLYKNMVIVNASSESQSIRALDKKTGLEIWKAEGAVLSLSFSSPAILKMPDGHDELIIAAPGEIWGLNPDTGKLRWFAEVNLSGNVCPSVVVGDGIVFVTGGFQSKGTVAVRGGGKDNVTKTHIVWTSRESSYVPSPVLINGKLYWVDESARAVCLNAATGETVSQQRLTLNGNGKNGKPIYGSIVSVADKFILVTRNAGVLVLQGDSTFKTLITNKLPDESDFNATPAVANNQIFIRSNVAVYCIGSKL